MTNRSVWLSNISPSKNISSPTTFPSNESVFCLWRVNVPRGYRIKVHFNSFDVKNTSNCSQAAVEVAEIQGVFNTVLGRYCGEQPDDVVPTFSFVTVIYSVSKGSTQVHPGFHASLLLAPAGKTINQLRCGGSQGFSKLPREKPWERGWVFYIDKQEPWYLKNKSTAHYESVKNLKERSVF